jgi:uncharacterized protein (TIGR02757 family)
MKLKDELDKIYELNNSVEFIKKDPVQIPHKFSKKEDVEISAFLTSILAFGKREIIINKANDLMNRMNNQPYKYLLQGNFENIKGFKHRTINDIDIIFYLTSLKEIYKNGGLEKLFLDNVEESLIQFWKVFFALGHEKRSERHIPNIKNGSAGKRLNLFLRWMVRKDNVDFGLWKNINPANLYIPLDIHVGNTARELNIISRKLNDWKSVIEITDFLKKLDPIDPIKYDLSLFSY